MVAWLYGQGVDCRGFKLRTEKGLFCSQLEVWSLSVT